MFPAYLDFVCLSTHDEEEGLKQTNLFATNSRQEMIDGSSLLIIYPHCFRNRVGERSLCRLKFGKYVPSVSPLKESQAKVPGLTDCVALPLVMALLLPRVF